jgi:hypothetical protein
MRLFVDMDGVLADFDTGYRLIFGVPIKKKEEFDVDGHDVDWSSVSAHGRFYRDSPPMPDAEELWDYVKHFRPSLLTGIPSSVPEAAGDKRQWMINQPWLRYPDGSLPAMRCCKSKEKSIHAAPGDVLIDDWEKYKELWIKAGGIWVTHVSAVNTIGELKTLGITPDQFAQARV